MCRSFENETKQTSKAFILQTLGLAVRRMGGRSAALGPIVTLLTAMQKVLTHSDVTVSVRQRNNNVNVRWERHQKMDVPTRHLKNVKLVPVGMDIF